MAPMIAPAITASHPDRVYFSSFETKGTLRSRSFQGTPYPTNRSSLGISYAKYWGTGISIRPGFTSNVAMDSERAGDQILNHTVHDAAWLYRVVNHDDTFAAYVDVLVVDNGGRVVFIAWGVTDTRVTSALLFPHQANFLHESPPSSLTNRPPGMVPAYSRPG